MDNGTNPFILLAKVTVKDDKVDNYLEIAKEVDQAVEKSEEGMLFHNFDRDPDNENIFIWTELYRDSNALLFHLNNPPVQEYVQKHANLAESLSIEIYGNVSEEAINALNSMEIPIKNYKTSNVGFIRSSILK